MKRNLLALGAVVLAIAISSFTVKRVANIYLVYTGGTQKDVTHYNQQTPNPGTFTNSNPVQLAWFRASDSDLSGIIEETEFNSAFESLDVTSTSSNLLTDETEQSGTVLEFK